MIFARGGVYAAGVEGGVSRPFPAGLPGRERREQGRPGNSRKWRSHLRDRAKPCYARFRNAENITIMGKISSRPSSMSKLRTSLEK